jgi:hypothetical protein
MFSLGLLCGKDFERRDGLEGPMLSPDINSEMSMVMNCSVELSFGTIANVISPSSSDKLVMVAGRFRKDPS